VTRAPRRTPVVRRAGPRVTGRGDVVASLILIFPLFLLYEIGVMFSTTVNGVDFVTRSVFAAVGYDRTRYLLAHAVLTAAFLGLTLYLTRRRAFSLGVFPPMLLESAIYALTLGSSIILVMERLLGFDPGLSLAAAVAGIGRGGEHLVMALGAGVHEELVFRLGGMAGGAALLKLLGIRHSWAVVGALVISSALFSAAHHIGPHGDPWQLSVFTYRALAGAIFGLIFYFRSLAHAVYTHFLYDLYVFLLRA
jgi:hypothetical protein